MSTEKVIKKMNKELKNGIWALTRKFFLAGATPELIQKEIKETSQDQESRYGISLINDIGTNIKLSNYNLGLMAQCYFSLLSSIESKYSNQNIENLTLSIKSASLEFIELTYQRVKEPLKFKRITGAIPLWNESPAGLRDRRIIGCALEDCFFCSQKTSTWHMETNNPICLECAKIYKVEDIYEDYGQNIRAQKRKGTFKLDGETRAN